MLSLPARVEKNIERHALLRAGDPVLVAVSGGLDSMVLLRVLHDLSKSKGWRLTVAHFDHQLRGRAGREDGRFVARAAAALDLEFIREQGDVTGLARSHAMSTEMAARTLRHQFLARAARAAGVSTVALAHHADDQVELFFLRLFRGAGSEGLAGMDWQAPSPADRDVRLIRPFLEERREALVEFARDNRLRFRADSSNFTMRIPRNRIRHRLLPLLRRDYQVALDPVVLRIMETLRGDADYIAEQAKAWLRARRKPPFDRLPVALQRHLLCLQLRALNVPVGFDLVEQLRQRAGDRVSVGPGQILSRDATGTIVEWAGIAFRVEQLRLNLEHSGETRFGDLELTWSIVAPRRQDGPRTEVFDADKVGSEIVLRHWRPGDRFRTSGLSRAAKLQDLFVNQRVPKEDRRCLVIATTCQGDIFWVEGLRIAEGFKLDKQSRRGLKWTWQRTEAPQKGRLRRPGAHGNLTQTAD